MAKEKRLLITKVMDLRIGEYVGEWTLPPREAVIAAHAQLQRNDWNTWDYEKRYGHLVEHGKHTVTVGNHTALLEEEGYVNPLPPKYIREKVEELEATDLLLIPELVDSGWTVKQPFREYKWLWHFPNEARYERWGPALDAAIKDLGYQHIPPRGILSADKKVMLSFGARDVGWDLAKERSEYVRAILTMQKPFL